MQLIVKVLSQTKVFQTLVKQWQEDLASWATSFDESHQLKCGTANCLSNLISVVL